MLLDRLTVPHIARSAKLNSWSINNLITTLIPRTTIDFDRVEKVTAELQSFSIFGTGWVKSVKSTGKDQQNCKQRTNKTAKQTFTTGMKELQDLKLLNYILWSLYEI